MTESQLPTKTKTRAPARKRQADAAPSALEIAVPASTQASAPTAVPTPAPLPALPSKPKLRTCDIVMKGGITSGVVYPQAITRLSARYQFVNIGGTSAGAIAAAIAAAAEYRRQKSIKADPNATPDNGGFAKLDELPNILGQKPGHGERTKLFYFFQPNAGTRRLFDVLTTMLGGGATAIEATLRRALKEYSHGAGLGSLLGFLLAAASIAFGTGTMLYIWAAVGLVMAAVGAVLGALAEMAAEFIREVPRNGYGLCTGMVERPGFGESPAPDGAEPLSAWLHDYLKETAGLPANAGPLTFGDLWGTLQSDREIDPERVVNLEMMTTCLTHGRPYRLPFRDDEDLHENHRFFFRPEELRRYFPEDVVRWMVDHAGPLSDKDKGLKDDRVREDEKENENDAKWRRIRERCREHGYYQMPAPAHLPVVVATRMSLSFPVLLCAVPLHAFIHGGWDKTSTELPARCWFSDGGLTSNFPVHFFDTALPRRPTFSIDLIDKPLGTSPAEMVPDMDQDNNKPLDDRWNQFDVNYRQGSPSTDKPDLDRMIGFFSAIITAMQNWTDVTQARLPGYRDRIVRVPLTPDEGGLNLDMADTLIKALSERGGEAADKLISHFCDPAPDQKMTWENHRWIRLRSLCGALEKTLKDIIKANRFPEPGDPSYDAWLVHLEDTWGKNPREPQQELPSYNFKGEQQREQLIAIQKTLQALQEISKAWVPGFPPAHSAPRPRPILRPRAQI